MRLPRAPHSWRLSPRRAIAVQRELAARVSRESTGSPIRFVAGLDAAFPPDQRLCIAGVVLWDATEHRVIGSHTATRRLWFPYVPGLLSFREAPALLAALRKLKHPPDALLCDGQGLAHPRRFGIACHVGLICDLPSVGCAKSRLIGEFAPPGNQRGDSSPLSVRNELVGEVLRTQTGIRPLFVSIGHRIDLPGARELVLRCAIRHRLPEPTRLAARLVAAARKQAAPAGAGGTYSTPTR